MADWQPIETAPKDGTRILVYVPWVWPTGEAAWQMDVAAFDKRAGIWFHPTPANYVQGCEHRPTCWQPLPTPPSVGS